MWKILPEDLKKNFGALKTFQFYFYVDSFWELDE